VQHALTVLWTSFRIGWENESNWTWRPVYFLYAAIRPFALCLILYFLFRVSSQDPSVNPTFVSVYLGNAFFTIFMAVTGGIGWVIIEDREWFRIIRYVYIAPMNFILYILGRTLLILLVSIASLLIILAFGSGVLGIDFAPAGVDWAMLAVSFALGLASTIALGVILAGFVIITARHATLLAEGVGGAFLLLCGVIYPVDLLPAGLRAFAWGVPLTYWMEATRRALSRPAFGQTLAAWSDLQVMLALLATTAMFAVGSLLVYRLCLRFAKSRGKIDQVTHY